HRLLARRASPLAGRRFGRDDSLSHLLAALDADEIGALEHASDALVIALVRANRERGAARLLQMRAIALDVALRRLGAEQPIEEAVAALGLRAAGIRDGRCRLVRAKRDIARGYADCLELPAGILGLRQRAIKRDDRVLCH